MERAKWTRAAVLACALSIWAASPAAESAHRFSGQPLDSVLENLRGQGVQVIYSSALVTPEMKVSTEPAGATPREVLDHVLEPHGLKATAGPNGSVVVVKGSGATDTGSKPAKPGIVSFVKVVSDKIEDVSSLEAWKKSFIKDTMTDEEKALAIWNTVVKFRHQASPPNEFVFEGNVHDPIKTFNVYGYGMCCCASSNIESLSRYVGLKAQGRGINRHSVPEVFWDNSWHLLDGSLITYFPKPDKKIASVDEIIDSITDWYGKNPGLKGNDKKLVDMGRGGGWKKGPAVMQNCPWYNENGWLPAATHGWYSNMAEYDGSSKFPYEYGYSQGYQVNNQLREGERLTRNWFNKGLHVNQAEGDEGAPINSKIGEGDMGYAPKWGDIAPGRIGNGTLDYAVPLASGAFRGGALVSDNLESKSESGNGPAVHVKDAATPGVLIIRMNSSYVYLGGKLDFQAMVGQGGELNVAYSENNGLDWKELSKVTATGPQSIDLKPMIYRRYDYRVKFELKGKDTGLDSLTFSNIIQHSQRALPALGQGSNTITFSTGADEGSITLEGSCEKQDPAKKKNLLITDFTKDISGFNPNDFFVGNTGKADITFPVTTPGDMTRIRMGCFYRARGQGEGWEYQASFDGGKTFKTMDKAEGPYVGFCKYITFSDVPAGTRSALIRYAGHQNNTLGLFGFRIDADYKETNGGFRPVKVTYVWDENGAEKQDVHIAAKPSETYTIKCDAKPTMKSIILELAN